MSDALTGVRLSKSLKAIPQSVFLNCDGIESVIIPDGVTEISKYAFSGCTSLKAISVPKALYVVDLYAFEGCVSLVNVEYGATAEDFSNIVIFTGNDAFIGAYGGGADD